MVASAVQLLARRGLQGASFSEVLHLAGAPRGSVYHHFPEGKDQLIGQALDLTESRLRELLDSWAGSTAEEITRRFLDVWRQVLVRSDFGAGCAVLAVTIETDSEQLLTRTADIFRGWRVRLAALLKDGGLPAREAARLSVLLLASSEGAVVLSRAERSLEPFDLVAEQLLRQVRTSG
jgi:AcrR family transcriptional regulator